MDQSTDYKVSIKEQIISHLAWLTGVEEAKKADFCYGDLAGVNLPNVKLSRAVFAGCDLRGANLAGCDLREAEFYCADLTGADLTGADLTGADLRGAKLNDAVMARVNLTGADLSSKRAAGDHPFAKISRYDRATGGYHNDTSMVDVDLSDAQMKGAQLVGCDLSGAILSGASIAGADFSDATLVGASLEEAEFGDEADRPHFVNALFDFEAKQMLEDMRIDLGDRDFELMTEDAVLAAVDAHEAWLDSKGKSGKRLQFDLARLPAVDLTGRRLATAVFRRCVLMGINFSNADLTLATLSYSDLRAAQFSETDLSGADLRKAKIDGADFADAKMNRAQYGREGRSRPVNMTKLKGGAAKIRVAQADGVILSGADLRACLMNLIFLGGANRTGALLPEKATQRASAIASAFAPARSTVPIPPKPKAAPVQQDTERVWGAGA